MKIQRKILGSVAAVAGLLCCVSTQTAQADNTQSTYWGDTQYGHVAGDGGGGFNFNNGPVIGGAWDDFADFGDLAFTAVFNNTTISTVSSWNGSTTIQPFGSPPNTATYGQTFIDPAGATTLDSFTFYINDNGDGAVLPYQGLVTDWSGSLVGGAGHAAPNNLLYVSSVATYTGNGTFEAITETIPGGGLTLTPGDDYFMGLSSLPNGAILPTVGPGSSTPDAGSSMLLLGLSLGGITALRRRFAKV